MLPSNGRTKPHGNPNCIHNFPTSVTANVGGTHDNNKRLTLIPYDTRHRIRQLAYFCMMHEMDLVCHQSTRMDKWTFAILCPLLRPVTGLSLKKLSMWKKWLQYSCTSLSITWKNELSKGNLFGLMRLFPIISTSSCWLWYDYMTSC